MLKLAAIALGIVLVADPATGNTLVHYRDYILAALLALTLQPWVTRQFD